MTHPLRSFLQSEQGAVTVDWVVLAAAVVGLGVASVAAVRTGTRGLASDIGASLSNASVAALGSLGVDGYSGPYVSGGGRGVARNEAGACDDAGVCAPSTSYVTIGYWMDNGEYWTMSSVQVSGEDAVVTWTNNMTGEIEEAPRWPS